MSNDGLPPGWFKYETEEGKAYFYNTVNNVTQWEAPVLQDQDSDMDLVREDVAVGDQRSSMVQDTPSVYKPTLHDVEAGGAAAAEAIANVGQKTLDRINIDLGGMAAPQIVDLETSPSGARGGQTHTQQDEPTQASGNPLLRCGGCDLATLQTYFDISTDEVLMRLRCAILPFGKGGARPLLADPHENFVEEPDFYGPFWVATTCVIFLASAGNYAQSVDEGRIDPGVAHMTDFGLATVLFFF